MDDLIKNIGPRIREIRHSRNLSQASLSELASLSRAALIHIETQKAVPSLESLVNLAYALRVQVTDFFKVQRTRKKKTAVATKVRKPAKVVRTTKRK